MIQLLKTDQHPNIDHLVLEDDTPVDNIQSEKQQRLLLILPMPKGEGILEAIHC